MKFLTFTQTRAHMRAFRSAHETCAVVGDTKGAPALRYVDFPHYYVWKEDSRTWARRTKRPHKQIATRMFTVLPNVGELYYLRTLLQSVPGLGSFEECKIYQGVQLPTCRMACVARGLVSEDEEWKRCLRDACESKFPSAIRVLFAIILTHCTPEDPPALWEEFRDEMSEDFARQRRGTLHRTFMNIDHQRALYHLKQLLEESGKEYAATGLPEIDLAALCLTQPAVDRLVAQEREYLASHRAALSQLVLNTMPKLNAGLNPRERPCHAHLVSLI